MTRHWRVSLVLRWERELLSPGRIPKVVWALLRRPCGVGSGPSRWPLLGLLPRRLPAFESTAEEHRWISRKLKALVQHENGQKSGLCMTGPPTVQGFIKGNGEWPYGQCEPHSLFLSPSPQTMHRSYRNKQNNNRREHKRQFVTGSLESIISLEHKRTAVQKVQSVYFFAEIHIWISLIVQAMMQKHMRQNADFNTKHMPLWCVWMFFNILQPASSQQITMNIRYVRNQQRSCVLYLIKYLWLCKYNWWK